MTPEEEMLQQIEVAKEDAAEANRHMVAHRKAMLEAETNLLGARLRIQRLTEKLRLYRMSLLSSESEHKVARQQEIEEFRARMPEVMKKLK